jgi:alanine dehydrogenase
VLILSRSDVERLLDPDQLVEALAGAMADLSAGRASMPPRVAVRVPEADGLLGVMPGSLPSAGMLEAKLVSLFPRNAGTGVPTHQAVIAVFDPETGTPTAVLDGEHITAMRTAAGSALATRLLARDDASTLAILGTGVQARAHARMIPRVRPITEIRVAGRDPASGGALAETLDVEGTTGACGFTSYEEAMDGADIVCGTTHAIEPVIRRRWLSQGAHVNSVGSNPAGREVDPETVRDALVVVESRESALTPGPAGANDLIWPIRDGMIGPDHVHAEIGEIVAGVRPGRTSPSQITLYKSVGVAVQDAAAAALVLAAARREGAGVEFAL